MTTNYQAKFFAHALTREGGKGVERLQQSLLNASVDLNPHQVEAALFALRSPISKGALLADEVGLGKTIEAGLVICQLWAERKRKILVVCPASLRKQWQVELEDKFNLPCIVVDARAFKQLQKEGFLNPYDKPVILISSYPFAAKMCEELKKVSWHLVVMDEAHKLRNSYRTSNRVGQALKWALENRRKLLLTATPLQNSLTELYGIATLLDETYFGDLPTFRSRYVNVGGDVEGLRLRLKEFCWRTLRKDVLAFVKYTNRLPLTEAFTSSNRENALYEDVSKYLQDETTYAFPQNQRSMLTLVVRKVLASSTSALIGTLEHILVRLEKLVKDNEMSEEELLTDIFKDEPDLINELEEDREDFNDEDEDTGNLSERVIIDKHKLNDEIELVKDFIQRAKGLGDDTKAQHLLMALAKGWDRLKELGAAEKAVIFTESRRSMVFLKEFLEAHGYAGEVVCFSGGGKKDADTEEIYRVYKEAHPEDDTSRPVMMRHALIDAFKNKAKILIATEAGAEGINLQFCSMVVNYDLPWNPQRVEQRIGRCHRYGQKYDVVVINFCNTRNAADVRVYELLREKLKLFEGVFGASNDVLGIVDENGKSFERQINEILQRCRTKEEIEQAFDQLQKDFEEQINVAREKTCKDIIENLDDEVRARLKIDPEFARGYLDDGEFRFMALTRHVLEERAIYDENPHTFHLVSSPTENIPCGMYSIERGELPAGVFPHRLNGALGEWSIETAKQLPTDYAKVVFNVSNYEGRLSTVNELKGKRGYLRLDKVTMKSLDQEDFLLFSAMTEGGKMIDPDIAEKLFKVPQAVNEIVESLPVAVISKLQANATQYANATATQVGEENNAHFIEATDRILRWSEDQIAAATHKIETLRARQLELERNIRHARTLDEQVPLQAEFDNVRREIRRARANVTAIEDETDEKRRRLLDALQRKLVPELQNETLFTIQWEVL